MAKVIVTFEDIEDGVSVKMDSDPAFKEGMGHEELTEAQKMAWALTRLVTETASQEEHVHDENCNH